MPLRRKREDSPPSHLSTLEPRWAYQEPCTARYLAIVLHEDILEVRLACEFSFDTPRVIDGECQFF